MTHPLSQRARDLQPFRTIQILTEAKALMAAGRDIVRLDVGEPNFPTPRPVLDAAANALADGKISYTQPSGIQELKSAIAAHYLRTYGVTVDDSRIVITTGSSAALLMILSIVADRGQEVLSVQPGYPSHDVFARLGNARVRRIENAKEPFAWPSSLDLERAWTRETVGMLVASPANPTGATLSRDELEALVRSTEARGGVFVSDELYHGLNYDGRDVTALEVSDDTIVVNSFSKYFSMTGWRLGWLVCPPQYRDSIEMMSQHLYLAPPYLSQWAALACFHPETLRECEARRLEMKHRRDMLLEALLRIGFEVPFRPAGGFYIFADARRWTNDGEQFCRNLLHDAGVSCAPGIDFAPYPSFVRFSFAASTQDIERAVERLARHLR
jgi:aspartate/methionine/tyrosine aminotransferase